MSSTWSSQDNRAISTQLCCNMTDNTPYHRYEWITEI